MACREQILSNEYAEILVDYTLTKGIDEGEAVCYDVIDEQFSVLYAQRDRIRPISVSSYTYHSIPKLYGLMQQEVRPGAGFDPVNLIRSGILQVQRPPLSLTGKGVILGFVDTGIRYDHPVFRRADGSSRILSIWDQTIQSGQPPAGFSYGTEYTREEIDAALQQEDPYSVVPSRDTNGHGTALASVAAGSDLGYAMDFLGAAPDADIVMVKCKEAKPYLREYYQIPEEVPAYADGDIGRAVKYLDEMAREGERPVVICIGMGTNWGSHEGTSVLGRYLGRVALRRNRVVILAGGNEGNAGHHYQSVFEMPEQTAEEEAEIRVGEGEKGFLMELWLNTPNTMAVSIRSPGGETVPMTDFRTGETRNYSFIYEKTRIAVDYILVEQGSGDALAVFRFQDPTPGVWTIRMTIRGDSGKGSVFLWLPITEFLHSDTYFLRSVPGVTFTEPSLARHVITTSFYRAENNSLAADSGRGYARDGRVVPAFSAPGIQVSTILGAYNGSSMAAALTAGAAAQFMQWAVVEKNDILANSVETEAYLIRGADRARGETYPNPSWGYGRLEIGRTFDLLAGV